MSSSNLESNDFDKCFICGNGVDYEFLFKLTSRGKPAFEHWLVQACKHDLKRNLQQIWNDRKLAHYHFTCKSDIFNAAKAASRRKALSLIARQLNQDKKGNVFPMMEVLQAFPIRINVFCVWSRYHCI